ncbi:winged helix-turn-helix transcriptional regulator [Mediterraneibacter faecis]|uniref:winged helix-turn-helix transcriptional regulator n=1 Tax=Mediterraneibacter faecis TaxID=592978 RepID=UPI002FE6CFB1
MFYDTGIRKERAYGKEGLIERIEYQQIPPKVEYKLSDIGEKLKKRKRLNQKIII